MSPQRFDHLLSLVEPLITKQTTTFREPISAGERLAVTLRYLASMESQQSLSFSYRIGKSTVSSIIKETCDALYTVLAPVYLCPPTSHADWKKIANKFEETWNLPHVVGALDGKHIRIRCPAETGTLFHNYKGFFSLVLLAACDADYCFTVIDIGQYGSNNDSSVLNNCEIGKRFESGAINLPSPETLEGCNFDPLPYYMVGDEIFPLKTWLMRPYPGKLSEEQRVFNYRQSRARRVIENAFGILTSRWRIFNTPIHANVENVESYVRATIVLHNYLRQTENASYCPKGFIDSYNANGEIQPGHWRNVVRNDSNAAFKSLPKVRGSRYRDDAVQMRDSLKDYVNGPNGSVSWQLDHIRRT